MTLAIVLDGSGFPRRSRVFAGNASEPARLNDMLSGLGHLFISVLAYHFVQTLRLQLKARGIDDSWQTLRETLTTQQRVTATLQRRDGSTVHVRKASRFV